MGRVNGWILEELRGKVVVNVTKIHSQRLHKMYFKHWPPIMSAKFKRIFIIRKETVIGRFQ